MPWLNIKQNLSGTVRKYFSHSGNLYAITEPDAGGSWTIVRLDAARAGASWATDALYFAAAPNNEYTLTGVAEDLSNGYMYVANAAHGEVYINTRDGDFTSAANWVTTRGPFGGYIGAQANLQELVYYNRKVYLAHRGGVSFFNSEQEVNEWQQIADFATGFDGVGQCSGLTVLDGVLFVIVSFDTLYAIYRYDAFQDTLKWEKYTEYPRSIIDSASEIDLGAKPRYITSRGDVIYATDYGLNLNVFNSRGLDTTLTGQPRFTQGVHLDGVPSSMLTHIENGLTYIFVTCWDTDFSGQSSNAFSENLITSFNAVDLTIQLPEETRFTDFNMFGDSPDVQTSIGPDGAYHFIAGAPVTDPTKQSSFSSAFHIKTNVLELLPDETYTIIWEHTASARAWGSGNTRDGGGNTIIGFSNLAGDDIDRNSPHKMVPIPQSNFLTANNYGVATFTFNTGDINADTTDGSIYIQGSVGVSLTMQQLLSGEFKSFRALAYYRNIELYRGNVDEANATYMGTEYVIKEYANISPVEFDNHAIEPPSPPDQWFIKFPRNPALSTTETVGRLSRRVITNKMTLESNQTYKLHFMIKRAPDGVPSHPYKVRTISPISGIPELSATCSGTEQRPFEWTFPTFDIVPEALKDIQFEIEIWEEDILPGLGATFYISDVNIQQRITQVAENTIYRFDGQAWDDVQTRLSNDGGVLAQPFGLHEEFETNSNATRLYCIANGIPYVWSSKSNDPFGGQVIPRIAITWDSSDQ